MIAAAHDNTTKGGISPQSGHPYFIRLRLLIVLILVGIRVPGLLAADSTSNQAAASALTTHPGPFFIVRSYSVEGIRLPSQDSLATIFATHSGTNVSLDEIVLAASQLQTEYARQGIPGVSIALAPDQILNGNVTLHVFRANLAQILVSGMRYSPPAPEVAISGVPPSTNATTNAPPPSTASQPAGARTNAPAATTPSYMLTGYMVEGNTLLDEDTLQRILSKYTGPITNVNDFKTNIIGAGNELQLEYFDRGYPTAKVIVPAGQPPLDPTNAIVRMQIIEGTLAEINVRGNRYFSSNNVMRSLPSLKTNMILNSRVLQAEIDRANANQDRQVFPFLTNGPISNTSVLFLDVKDRLPLHAKTELNNQNSPGTPELRVNSSAVYNNLWQLNHSLGVQYSFSPEVYKQGNQWQLYDLPLVANYSGFYRLPLGNPQSIADVVEANPGSFGYDEGTRQFNLPPPSGASELNLYASRSTIDTGVQSSPQQIVFDLPGVRQIYQNDDQQSLTVNDDVGFRITKAVPDISGWHSSWSSGLDLKTYDLTTFKTNNFQFTEITVNPNGTTNPPIISTVSSPVPVTRQTIQYAPLALRYDGSMRDLLGTTAFGLGLSYNLWHSSSLDALQSISGSSESHGHWVTLTPSFSQSLTYLGGWTTAVRADGQWASEPLISNEQFGAGGVNSVRGYHEGEIFGDTGWHISLEQDTPPRIVGLVAGRDPITIRGSIYMDYADTFLLDPQGRPGETPLWSTGFGFVGSIGTHWESRFLFSLPLLDAGTIEKDQPYFGFSLTAQF